MSLFGDTTVVTQEDMAPPSFEPIKQGNYPGTFSSPEKMSNDAGWEGIKFNTLLGGESQFAGRTVDGLISTKQAPDKDSDEAKARDAATVARLLRALGVATVDDDGNVDLSGINSTDDVFELLQAADGTEYQAYVKTGPDKRGGVVQTKDDGTPWIKSRVTGFDPLEG